MQLSIGAMQPYFGAKELHQGVTELKATTQGATPWGASSTPCITEGDKLVKSQNEKHNTGELHIIASFLTL